MSVEKITVQRTGVVRDGLDEFVPVKPGATILGNRSIFMEGGYQWGSLEDGHYFLDLEVEATTRGVRAVRIIPHYPDPPPKCVSCGYRHKVGGMCLNGER